MKRWTPPKKTVTAEALSVKWLFDGARYRIPEYQRDYVWGAEHAAQLVRDVYGSFREGCTTHDERPYFLGAFVVIPDASPTNPLREVVDGQQRLITLSLIGAALESKITELSNPATGQPNPANEWDPQDDLDEVSDLLREQHQGNWRCLVALSTQKNNDAFRELISERKRQQKLFRQRVKECAESWGTGKRGKRPGATRRALIEASRSVIEEIDNIAQCKEKKELEELHSFNRYLQDCVVLLRISVENWERAFDLFESLNFKGVKLALADRIKNHVLGAYPGATRAAAALEWSNCKSVIDDLETSLEFDDILHYCYLSRYGRAKSRSLMEKIKEVVAAKGGAESFALHVSNDAKAIESIVKRDPSIYTNDAKESLETIGTVLRVKFAYVGLLALAGRYKSKKDKAVHARCVRTLENFIFRFMKVLRNSDARLMDIMMEYARHVREGRSESELAQFLCGHATDQAFVRAFPDLTLSDGKLGYYVASCLEKVIAGPKAGVAPRPHGTAQHLEHILPVKPEKSAWGHLPNLDKEDFEEKCRSVGNLLPLAAAVNASIKNAGIDVKMKEYDRQSLVSPKELAQFLESGLWTFDSIEKRAEYLAQNYCQKAWSLT
jgi:hypothetical protein